MIVQVSIFFLSQKIKIIQFTFFKDPSNKNFSNLQILPQIDYFPQSKKRKRDKYLIFFKHLHLLFFFKKVMNFLLSKYERFFIVVELFKEFHFCSEKPTKFGKNSFNQRNLNFKKITQKKSQKGALTSNPKIKWKKALKEPECKFFFKFLFFGRFRSKNIFLFILSNLPNIMKKKISKDSNDSS